MSASPTTPWEWSPLVQAATLQHGIGGLFGFWRDEIGPWIKDVSDLVQQLILIAGLLIALLALARLTMRSWQLLYRSLFYDHFFPALRILRELLFCFFYVHKTHSLFRAVRLRVELEILQPRPVRSFEGDASWGERFRHWRSYLKEKGEWRRGIRDRLRELAAASGPDHRPVYEVDNCFALYSHSDGIRRYLSVVAVLPGQEGLRGRFITRIRIRDGHLMPLHLLTGLLSHFDEDWKPILNNYSRIVDEGYPPLDIFLFVNWIIWGPSIPVCTCSQWRSGVALQFGFGDENNSIPIYVPGEARKAVLESIDESSRRSRKQAGQHPAIGFRTNITGTLMLGKMVREREIAVAQECLLNPDACDFMLEYETHLEKGYQEKASTPGFYTAYVWVMFEREEDEAPQGRDGDRPWLRLVPFWVHANIADGAIYSNLKEHLARDVVEFVARLPEGVRLRYACAFDHAGCGNPIIQPPEGPPVRELIAALLAQRQHYHLAGRIVFGPPDQPTGMPACHLPEVVAKFYKDVEIYNEISLAKEISLQWLQLEAIPRDFVCLEKIYRDFYDPGVSAGLRWRLAGMKRHLREYGAGGSESRDRFHVLVLFCGTEVIACSLSRYLSEANAGVIEMVAVAPGWRKKGIGRRVLQQTELMLRGDASAAGKGGEPPLVVAAAGPAGGFGRLTPYQRARVWHAWGYRRLDLPGEPEPDRPAEDHWFLAGKVFGKSGEDSVPAETFAGLLQEYASLWRKERPQGASEFGRLVERLHGGTPAKLTPFFPDA